MVITELQHRREQWGETCHVQQTKSPAGWLAWSSFCGGQTGLLENDRRIFSKAFVRGSDHICKDQGDRGRLQSAVGPPAPPLSELTVAKATGKDNYTAQVTLVYIPYSIDMLPPIAVEAPSISGFDTNDS